MSAPALPDIFGNYLLGENFVEVTGPDPISWLPQTAGWACLGAVALLLLARWCWLRLRQWYRDRYRREANAKLHALTTGEADETWLVELNRLLKLTALAAFSRERVASLTGKAWVHFLNSRCAEPVFHDEVAELLSSGVYRQEIPPPGMRALLIKASQRWVALHENARG